MPSAMESSIPLYRTKPTGFGAGLFWYLRQWRQNVRSRKQLARLDGRLLADAGISEAQRQEELAKPFWR